MRSQKSFPHYLFICLFIVTCVFSCRKDPAVPEIQTDVVSHITASTALSGGNVINDGGARIVSRGVCWSTNANPTLECERTIQDGNTGWFRSNIISLNPGTQYFVRAYATNDAGTGYGNVLTFTTNPAAVPTVITISVTSTTDGRTCPLKGEVIDDGGSPVTERGFCWAALPGPTIDGTHTHDGTGTGVFTGTLTINVSEDIRYRIRAYAVNATGTGYGNELSYEFTGGCKK